MKGSKNVRPPRKEDEVESEGRGTPCIPLGLDRLDHYTEERKRRKEKEEKSGVCAL
jgi:hypothetical protein